MTSKLIKFAKSKLKLWLFNGEPTLKSRNSEKSKAQINQRQKIKIKGTFDVSNQRTRM